VFYEHIIYEVQRGKVGNAIQRGQIFTLPENMTCMFTIIIPANGRKFKWQWWCVIIELREQRQLCKWRWNQTWPSFYDPWPCV